MAKRGRPRKQLDEKAIENMAMVGCTVTEIASLMGVSTVTLRKNYLPIIEKGKDRLKNSLRKAQIKSALSGNVTMQIWLGKQYLGQTDRQEAKTDGEVRITVEHVDTVRRASLEHAN